MLVVRVVALLHDYVGGGGDDSGGCGCVPFVRGKSGGH